MAVYADTNFLGSYYLPDANSALAIAAARLLSVPIMFSALHRLELRTTIRQCAYGGLLKEASARLILRFIEDDFNLTGLQGQVPMYKEALEVCA